MDKWGAEGALSVEDEYERKERKIDKTISYITFSVA